MPPQQKIPTPLHLPTLIHAIPTAVLQRTRHALPAHRQRRHARPLLPSSISPHQRNLHSPHLHQLTHRRPILQLCIPLQHPFHRSNSPLHRHQPLEVADSRKPTSRRGHQRRSRSVLASRHLLHFASIEGIIQVHTRPAPNTDRRPAPPALPLPVCGFVFAVVTRSSTTPRRRGIRQVRTCLGHRGGEAGVGRSQEGGRKEHVRIVRD